MIRFLHTGDWHPRSEGTICGKHIIDPKTGLSQTLTDFENSLEWMFGLIIQEKIELLLIAGDIFDSHHPSMDEIRVVMNFISNASSICTVVLIPGNHDLAQNGSLASAIEPMKHIEGVHVATRPTSISLRNLGPLVRVDCLPYPTKGRLLAKEESAAIKSPEELNETVNRLLQRILGGFAVNHHEGEIKVLLAHGSVRNATIGEQPRSIAHDIFIPLPQVKLYNYIALGHIHQHQQVGDAAYYAGSLLRQSFGEEKERKGCIIGILEENGTHTIQFHDNPFARTYQTVTVEEMATLAMDAETAYRVKGDVDPASVQLVQTQIETLQGQAGHLQVNIDIVNPDRMRNHDVSSSMTSTQALEHMMIHHQIDDERQRLLLGLHLALVEGRVA